MNSYFNKVTTSKAAFRKKLAQKSIEEKLTLLDRLAERSQALIKSGTLTKSGKVARRYRRVLVPLKPS